MFRKLVLIMLAIVLLVPVNGSLGPVWSQAPSVVYVDQDYSGGNGSVNAPYDTIAEGIGAVAAGGTVLVAPGTYVENLTISQDLTLRGSGLDVTTIDGGGQGDTIALTQDGLSVTVEGFRITGAGRVPTNDKTFMPGPSIPNCVTCYAMPGLPSLSSNIFLQVVIQTAPFLLPILLAAINHIPSITVLWDGVSAIPV